MSQRAITQFFPSKKLLGGRGKGKSLRSQNAELGQPQQPYTTRDINKRQRDENVEVEPEPRTKRLRAKSKILPASKRFSNLTTKEEPGLPLPPSYERLLDTYTWLDHQLTGSQNNEINFSELQNLLEGSKGRKFSNYELGQIIRISDGQLEVDSIRDTTGKAEFLVHFSDNAKDRQPCDRINQVFEFLLNHTKLLHTEFLSSRVPQTSAQVNRWHPAFDLDKVVEIQPADVPTLNRSNERAFSVAESKPGNTKQAAKLTKHVSKAEPDRHVPKAELLKHVSKLELKRTLAKPDVTGGVPKPEGTPELITKIQPPATLSVSTVNQMNKLLDMPGLSLPDKYRRLLDLFCVFDNALCRLHNRCELANFGKLQKAVQSASRRHFGERELGQVVKICDGGLLVELDTKGTSQLNGLFVTPILAADDESSKTKEGRVVFTVKHVVQRKLRAQAWLMNRTMQLHREYLDSRSCVRVSDNELRRWHPGFSLETVPDIEAVTLPRPPQVKRLTSAADLLKSLTGKLPPAVETKLKSELGTESKPKTLPSATSSNTAKPPLVKGIPQHLLDKIRARESARTAQLMKRSVEDEERRDRLERLGSSLTTILRGVFVTARKPAIALDTVSQQLADSYRLSMSAVSAREHIEEAARTCGFWIQIVDCARGKFVKLDKNVDLKRVTDTLKKVHDQL